MSWDDFLNPHEQGDYECQECGTSMIHQRQYCSTTCFEASMR